MTTVMVARRREFRMRLLLFSQCHVRAGDILTRESGRWVVGCVCWVFEGRRREVNSHFGEWEHHHRSAEKSVRWSCRLRAHVRFVVMIVRSIRMLVGFPPAISSYLGTGEDIGYIKSAKYIYF